MARSPASIEGSNANHATGTATAANVTLVTAINSDVMLRKATTAELSLRDKKSSEAMSRFCKSIHGQSNAIRAIGMLTQADNPTAITIAVTVANPEDTRRIAKALPRVVARSLSALANCRMRN